MVGPQGRHVHHYSYTNAVVDGENQTYKDMYHPDELDFGHDSLSPRDSCCRVDLLDSHPVFSVDGIGIPFTTTRMQYMAIKVNASSNLYCMRA